MQNLVGNSRFSSPLKTEEFNLDFNKDEDSQDQRKLLKVSSTLKLLCMKSTGYIILNPFSLSYESSFSYN